MMPAMDARYRACPLCEAVCGLEFRYRDGELAAIHGDKADAFSRGHICPKGNAILDLEGDSDRLRRPVRRVGGAWVEVEWDEAFRAIARRFHELQSAHGKSTVAVYLGNPTAHHLSLAGYVGQLLRAIGSKNVFSASSVDQWPHQLVCWQMYGHQWLLPIPDLDRLDTLLVIGANPVASNGSLMTAPDVAKRLQAIRRRGALIVVDPRRTETAAAASEHHPIRPGSDVLFLRDLLLALRRLGPPRLEAYVGKLAGFDAAMARVAAPLGADDSGAARTGISAAAVEAIAERLYAAENAAVYGRVGVSMQRHGTVAQYLIQLCNLYLGQLDRAGGCLPNEAAIPVTGPGTAPGSRGRWHSRVRGLPEVSGELPVAVLREEIETEGEGRVRALLTVAGNPVSSTPNGAALGRALDKANGHLEFQVAIDPYVNETTRHADWILPPPSFLTEDHYDLYFNAFAIRRVARLNTPIAETPPGSLPQWRIVEGLVGALRAERGESHQTFLSPSELVAKGLARGPTDLTVEDLLAAPHGIDLGPLEPSLLRRLETASGAIECAPPLLVELLDDALAELAECAEPEPMAALPGSPTSLSPLSLIGRRHVANNNSWMHNAPRLVKGKPRHQLLMHPSDLAARGLADGSAVRVRSRTGEVLVEVQATTDMMPGVVSLPHGFGHRLPDVRLARATELEGVSINDLTDDLRIDPGTGNAAFSGTPVVVEAVG
jgi:anaerobic selenocysteine-containing dehydrogenase